MKSLRCAQCGMTCVCVRKRDDVPPPKHAYCSPCVGLKCRWCDSEERSVPPRRVRQPVDLSRWTVADMRQDGGGVARLNQLHWVIQGGESGGNARPFDMAWARSMRDQCAAAGVPYFFKQTGAHCHWDGDGVDTDSGPLGEECAHGEARLVTANRAGADPAEWPEDMRIQQVPNG